MSVKYINRDRTYRLIDFLVIPFRAAPVPACGKCVNMLLSALMTTAQAMATALFVDTALAIFAGNDVYHAIFTPLIYLLLIVAYGTVSSTVNKFTNLGIDQKLASVYRTEILEKRARLAYYNIEDNKTWDLITRVCKEPEIRIRNAFCNILDLAEIIVRVGSLLLLITAQVWWAGLAILAISVPLFLVSKKAGQKEYTAWQEAEKHRRRADYLKNVILSREAAEERSLFGYTEDVNRRWLERADQARRIEKKTLKEQFIRMKTSSIITALLSLSIIAILLFPYARGELSSGMFISLVTATLSLVQMMSWQFAAVTNQLAQHSEYLRDLTKFCALPETEGALDYPVSAESAGFGTIEFQNVSFRYPGTEKYILQNLNLTLEPERHYAIVGINGAGKTTLTKLLTGLYDNFEGEILIGGRSIRDFTQAQLKAMFGVVYQDFVKYYVKAADNIALGNVLSYDEAKIQEAARFIGLDSAVQELPQGYDTYLGKIHAGGVDISGGQWQRFAIARALYNPAHMRILDEPTAALDPVAESEVYRLFGQISAGKSTVFITHRLGAARLADEIVVLDSGRVAEQGSHEKLVSAGGIYAEMFEAQRSWYA